MFRRRTTFFIRQELPISTNDQRPCKLCHVSLTWRIAKKIYDCLCWNRAILHAELLLYCWVYFSFEF